MDKFHELTKNTIVFKNIAGITETDYNNIKNLTYGNQIKTIAEHCKRIELDEFFELDNASDINSIIHIIYNKNIPVYRYIPITPIFRTPTNEELLEVFCYDEY